MKKQGSFKKDRWSGDSNQLQNFHMTYFSALVPRRMQTNFNSLWKSSFICQ